MTVLRAIFRLLPELSALSRYAAHRNRDIAQDLIRYGCEQMFLAGFHRLYASSLSRCR